jgi:hypothetical protein
MHQKCSHYALTNLFFWFVQVHVNNWHACHSSSPHQRAPRCPSTVKVLRTRECALIPYPFVIFTFGFEVEFIKELGGASIQILFQLLWKVEERWANRKTKGECKKNLIKLFLIARCIFCETFIDWKNKRCKGIFLPNHLEVELLTNGNWKYIFVHHNIPWIVVLRLILTPYHLFIIFNNHLSISFSLVELGFISHSYHFVLLQCFQRNMS